MYIDTNRRIKIHKYSIFPLGFLTSRACVYTKFKKSYQFSIVHHHALHITDDSSMKDVLLLKTAIVMASNAKKKISLQQFSPLVTISPLQLMMRPESLKVKWRDL